MKAILEFNLTDPDDVTSHLRCIKATDMACALWEIRNLGKELGWLEEEGKLTAEAVMEKIFEHFDNHNINTDELL